VTPEEWIRYIRREHAEISHPVACCRKDHQNWPCDTIRALEAGANAERKRIRELVCTRFKTVLVQPDNGYPVSAVPMAAFLDVLAMGEL